MNTHNVNTAASESTKTWVNGQGKQPERLAPEMVFVFRETGKICGRAIELDGEWVSLSGETLAELQGWYSDLELVTADEAARQYNARLIKPWAEIDAARYEDQLYVMPPLDWTRTPDGESFKSREMYSGDVTHIFACVRGRYFECRDRAGKHHCDLILSAALFLNGNCAH
ncbi:hypothetical protein [Candidatus Pantoea multigeneris]|uniref:Uncharacterized protein n=1 Tax=Candidatus Pantoea multigeneris TaxID=2608357 RepID=A0ABX0RG56_9GAMM|nr:hypothetical protein [Pantoea multigeneris]NIF24042.1 hypothetical protein [Pantoea multigeneris]